MDWIKTAYVGQRVVCIFDGNLDGHGGFDGTPIKAGKAYAIREIGIDVLGCAGIKVTGAQLDFIGWGPKMPSFTDGFWVAIRFRPLQSTDTGMAILRAILNQPHLERVD